MYSSGKPFSAGLTRITKLQQCADMFFLYLAGVLMRIFPDYLFPERKALASVCFYPNKLRQCLFSTGSSSAQDAFRLSHRKGVCQRTQRKYHLPVGVHQLFTLCDIVPCWCKPVRVGRCKSEIVAIIVCLILLHFLTVCSEKLVHHVHESMLLEY